MFPIANPCRVLLAAHIDVDEFFVFQDSTPNLPMLLHEYESYGGLAINWHMFGSSESGWGVNASHAETAADEMLLFQAKKDPAQAKFAVLSWRRRAPEAANKHSACIHQVFCSGEWREHTHQDDCQHAVPGQDGGSARCLLLARTLLWCAAGWAALTGGAA